MKKGFTIVEVIITIALLTIAGISLFMLFTGVKSAGQYIKNQPQYTPFTSEFFQRGDMVYIEGLNVTGRVVRIYGPFGGKWQYDVLMKSDNGVISTAERLDGFLIKGIKPNVQLEK